jgi:glycosyltransferase involved in cell wall biosynthesis
MHWDLEIAAAFDKMERKDQVIFSGRLEKQTLNLLLAGADGLIFPSLFEGFGIPIIEAFNAGTAVITSDITSMPEIAEDAALLVNPQNTNSIYNAIHSLAHDVELRKNLVQKGYAQAKKFSWDASAEKLWNIMLKTIES